MVDEENLLMLVVNSCHFHVDVVGKTSLTSFLDIFKFTIFVVYLDSNYMVFMRQNKKYLIPYF